MLQPHPLQVVKFIAHSRRELTRANKGYLITEPNLCICMRWVLHYGL
jgi:hypothetical protein